MRAGPVTEHHTNELIRACRSGLAPEGLNVCGAALTST